MGRIVLAAIGWGFAGLIMTPFAVFLAMLVLYSLDSRCGTPGDSGGCEMGMAMVILMSALPGFVLFFAVALIRGFMRRRRGI